MLELIWLGSAPLRILGSTLPASTFSIEFPSLVYDILVKKASGLSI
jgi:hypothetical protein